jgi:catechol 2,3-dioxygenase-like lactoylglutathione lyase family enzyme
MLTSARLVAFVPSTDLQRARQFYEDVLELEVIAVDGFAVVAESNDVQIRITHVGEQLDVQPFTILGWHVDDIGGAVADLAARGVEFLRVDGLDQDDAGVWTAPGGAHVAWFKDPDGNTLSFGDG